MNQVSDKARSIFESIIMGGDTAAEQLEGIAFETSEIEDEVKSLIKWYQQAESFLEYPLGEENFAAEGGEIRSGDQIQHYELIRLSLIHI